MATFVHNPDGRLVLTETTLNELVVAVAKAKDLGLESAAVVAKDCGVRFHIQM